MSAAPAANASGVASNTSPLPMPENSDTRMFLTVFPPPPFVESPALFKSSRSGMNWSTFRLWIWISWRIVMCTMLEPCFSASSRTFLKLSAETTPPVVRIRAM